MPQKKKWTTIAREDQQSKRKRDTTAGNARLVGLVGGQHDSVIEIDRRMLYCEIDQRYRSRSNPCEQCHLKKAEGGGTP